MPEARQKTPPKMTLREVRSFLEALALAYPDAASELDFVDPYTLLVAVVLSAQPTDASVNRATAPLFAAASPPAAMAALGVHGVAAHVRYLRLPHAAAPAGKTADDNPVVRIWGEKPSF